jgi:hypothetical protein
MNLIDELSKLPDYPALKKLAAALHRFDANQQGAAIMIGAGFSRSAARHVGGNKKMPLWFEFSKKLQDEINPDKPDISFSDPLRVAEEYRAYFGQAALNDRIRTEIDDEAWQVGGLHKALLKLPWAEVLTTNWDTLLERAAVDTHGPYYTSVTKPSDLTWAPSPRIVKLHGTIGTSDTFIAAQEDYRIYPQKFAPFVNLARQVFIENELCLLGFSGDDPNFLHWAGWVRDQLGGHARKIYLVGALNLSAARRKHLESINIAPIDLWDAVKQHEKDMDSLHQEATRLFLQAMAFEGQAKSEPHKWMPTSLARQQYTHDELMREHRELEYAATLLKQQLGILKKDRESYPGWLVCPPWLQRQVHHQISSPYPTIQNIAALAPSDRAWLLYEISWRYGVAFEYIPPWLADELFKIANPDEPCCLSKRQQLEVALVLLKSSRWLVADDEASKQQVREYVDALIAILEKHASYLPDCNAELAYHRAIVARDALDYAGLESAADAVEGEDPVWKLRKSSLLMELAKAEEGLALIEQAYGELRDAHRRDRYSISILSRLTWAHWLLKMTRLGEAGREAEELPAFAKENYQKWKCDPRLWLDSLDDRLNKRQEKRQKNQNPIEPMFEQGYYRDNSQNSEDGVELTDYLLLDGVSREVGIPLRTTGTSYGVTLLAWVAEKLMQSGGTGIQTQDFSLAIRTASTDESPVIKATFSRIGVACFPPAEVESLAAQILHAIEYWRQKRIRGTREQQMHALTPLRILIEVLGRLSVRVSPDKAEEIFRLVVNLGRQIELQHHWLFDAMSTALTSALSSIPSSQQGKLLPEALAFPLQNPGDRFPHHPNPVIESLGPRDSYVGIEVRLNELIEAVLPLGTDSSEEALLRLLPLVEKENFLSNAEREKLAKAIWGDAPDFEVLPAIGLRPHALLILPAPDEAQTKAVMSRHLYEHDGSVLNDTLKELRSFPAPEYERAISLFAGIANAAVHKHIRFYPSAEQAEKLFDRVVVWRPAVEKEDVARQFHRNGREALLEEIGRALSYAILPSMAMEARTAERFEKLKSFWQETGGSISLLSAFVYFSPVNEELAKIAEKMIRKSLQGRTSNEVYYAAIALQSWMELPDTERSPHLSRLIDRLIDLIDAGRTIGLQQLLWIAGKLLQAKRLSDDQVATLKEAVSYIFEESHYSNIDPMSVGAINASSIRAECARLANCLSVQFPDEAGLKGVLEEAKVDALPEVRFALERDDA